MPRTVLIVPFLLLALSCNPSASLHDAATRGDVAAVRSLLASGMGVDTRDVHGYCPIHLAAWNNHTDVLQYLLDAGAEIRAHGPLGLEPIHLACHGGHIETVHLLLHHGVPVNATDMIHATPLHWAADQNRVKMARYLMSRGADTSLRNTYGETPADVADKLGHKQLASELREVENATETTDCDGPQVRADDRGLRLPLYVQITRPQDGRL